MFSLENPSTIPGHTALPHTTIYQDLVVDSYTNLRGEYHCTAVFGNETRAGSNVYLPIAECEYTLMVICSFLVKQYLNKVL